MASKSKRRRRVLGASCILAALIIAGSSFAWFTSKDEVTNRLTASSDYGVSIVESFTPPKNWIPGQPVNKDVFTVNTGNIDAFVNVDVSGVLDYTYETLAGSFDATKAVKLNDEDITTIALAGATTMEAGSVLAWNSASEANGDKVIKADGSGWKPTAAGDYIFRRSIGSGTFTYSGYHYDGNGNYYKIVIGDDNFPYKDGTKHVFDVSSSSLGEGVTVDEDGIVVPGVNPTIRYVNEENAHENVTFFYEDATTGASAHPARLVVTSNAASVSTVGTAPNTSPVNASAEAARAEIDYLNKKKLSNDATKAYNQVKNDFDYANALIDARNTLIDAAKARYTAETTSTGKTTDSSNALGAVNTLATTIWTDSAGNYSSVYTMAEDGAIGKYALVPDSTLGTTLRGKINALTAPSQAKTNLTEFDAIYDAMYNTTNGTAKLIKEKLAEIKNYSTNSSAGANELATKLNELLALIDTMDDQLTDYDETFAILKIASTATGIDLDDSNAAHTAIEGVRTKLTVLKTALTTDTATPAYKSLKTLIAEFKTKAAEMDSASSDVTSAEATWKKAVDTYNTNVEKALTEYKKYCTGTTPGYQEVAQPDGTYLTDNSVTLSNQYSALSTGGPTIDVSSAYPAYDTIYDGTNLVNGYPLAYKTALVDTDYQGENGGSAKLSELKTAMDNAVNATNTAKTTYNNAMNKLKDDSAITIYVDLVDGYNANWEFDPNTNGTGTASFYLKKILEAGKNSDQLIDKIELAETVTAAAYKNMTFDLNVGLDSAQVTYADDQVTVTSDAVQNPAFGLYVKTIDQSSKAVTWDLPTN